MFPPIKFTILLGSFIVVRDCNCNVVVVVCDYGDVDGRSILYSDCCYWLPYFINRYICDSLTYKILNISSFC